MSVSCYSQVGNLPRIGGSITVLCTCQSWRLSRITIYMMYLSLSNLGSIKVDAARIA